EVVKPTEVSVLDPTSDNRLTLTTCNPKYSAHERLVVVSLLVEDRSPPVVAPPPAPPVTVRARRSQPGLSGQQEARWPTLLWAAVSAAVALAIWAVGRLWRRWPAYLLGTPVFLFVLFIFFE